MPISYYRYRPNPKRPKAMAAAMTRIVSAKHPNKVRRPRPEAADHAEAEARAMEFIKGMLRPRAK